VAVICFLVGFDRPEGTRLQVTDLETFILSIQLVGSAPIASSRSRGAAFRHQLQIRSRRRFGAYGYKSSAAKFSRLAQQQAG
jgi:hypothetical protein